MAVPLSSCPFWGTLEGQSWVGSSQYRKMGSREERSEAVVEGTANQAPWNRTVLSASLAPSPSRSLITVGCLQDTGLSSKCVMSQGKTWKVSVDASARLCVCVWCVCMCAIKPKLNSFTVFYQIDLLCTPQQRLI